MIGYIPESLCIGGTEVPIRSDYRVALIIFEAYADPDLTDEEKTAVMLQMLFEEKIQEECLVEACEKASWFLDGGEIYDDYKSNKQIIDWKQDESMIFSAVNTVAGYEVRRLEYMHWWTFLSYFQNIGDCLLSSVIVLRTKKNKGKKLEKNELEFYREHKKLIDIETKYSQEELAEIDRLNKLLG